MIYTLMNTSAYDLFNKMKVTDVLFPNMPKVGRFLASICLERQHLHIFDEKNTIFFFCKTLFSIAQQSSYSISHLLDTVTGQ